MPTWIAQSKWLFELMAGAPSGCGTHQEVSTFRFLLQINSDVHLPELPASP